MNAPGGLRERKKAAARQALHEAAVRLALEHGLDHVTTEAIADAAGLSRRTFSNYFAGKEDAILDGDVERLQDWLEALRGRPAGEPPWRALRASLKDSWLELDVGRVAAMRALRQHPSLLARQSAIYGAFEREVAGVLLARAGVHDPDDRRAARVQAAAFLTGLRVATGLWVEEPDVHHLAPTIDAVLDQIGGPFE